jgi:hypothetical protein
MGEGAELRTEGGHRRIDGAALAGFAASLAAEQRPPADELGLAPGVVAVASVKATNVVVELPAHREDSRNGKPL